MCARARRRPCLDEVLTSDEDADYAQVIDIDLAQIAPMVTVPPAQTGATPVQSVAGIRVHQATIGSCASNRLQDLRDAATVLRGRKIAKHVTMYISPGSQNTLCAGRPRRFARSVRRRRRLGALARLQHLLGLPRGVERQRGVDQHAPVQLPGQKRQPRCVGVPSLALDGGCLRHCRRDRRSAAALAHRAGRGPKWRPAMSDTTLRGRVWKFGDQVSGDDGIIDFSAVRATASARA